MGCDSHTVIIKKDQFDIKNFNTVDSFFKTLSTWNKEYRSMYDCVARVYSSVINFTFDKKEFIVHIGHFHVMNLSEEKIQKMKVETQKLIMEFLNISKEEFKKHPFIQKSFCSYDWIHDDSAYIYTQQLVALLNSLNKTLSILEGDKDLMCIVEIDF